MINELLPRLCLGEVDPKLGLMLYNDNDNDVGSTK